MSSSDIVAQFFDRAKYLYATSPEEPDVTAQSAGLELELEVADAVARRKIDVINADGFIVVKCCNLDVDDSGNGV